MPANRFRFNCFSLHKRNTITPEQNYSCSFNVRDNNRGFMVRSIYWNWQVRTTNDARGFAEQIPRERMSFMHVQLYLGNGTTDQIHRPFSDISLPMVNGIDFNGRRIYLHDPQQLNFQSWYVANTLFCAVEVWNQDGIHSFQIDWDCIIETELTE